MKPCILLLYTCFMIAGCKGAPIAQEENKIPAITDTTDLHPMPYDQLKTEIDSMRKVFAQQYRSDTSSSKNKTLLAIQDYWVATLGSAMYNQWQYTPWDFNGITQQPRQGHIACGYFVTTLLQDMGYRLNRIKLATCVSMKMMKTLSPEQPVKNLSYLDYTGFTDKMKSMGKGVYVIGLDYHTGFIINDGTDCWFLHSNYIRREGVTKEKLGASAALKASKTRFVTQLTANRDFLLRWLQR